MKTTSTVTIGIPAHNEEKSIGRLLDQLISQERRSFVIEKVIVRCDGCTDKTHQVVQSYIKEYPFIKLIDDGKRLGLSAGLTILAKMNTSDIFIGLDADCSFENSIVLEKIVKEFKNPKVGLVSANVLPISGKSFIERLAVCWILCWYEARKTYLDGDNVNNHFGCITAMRNTLAKKISIPSTIIGTHDFIYFSSKKEGYEYKFVKDARLFYHVASTLQDYLKQTARHHGCKDDIILTFGDWVLPSYNVPSDLKNKAMIKTFLKQPILFPLACLLQVYLRKQQAKFMEKNNNGLWTMIHSTK